MSYFGYNIRKIRIAKKLSQIDFANLFDLTRSSIGAYEEGRAEAKIDKIIEIANYFGINMTSFLTKKLSINEILHYDTDKVTAIWNPNFESIPYVENSKINQYIINYDSFDFINRLPKISIPDVSQNYRAFEFCDSTHFLNDEILICKPFDNKHKEKLIYFVLKNEGFELLEKISLRNSYLQIWVVDRVIIKNMFKIDTGSKLENILNHLKNK